MRKEIMIGVCFCVAGILCSCFFGYEYFTTYGFLNTYHLQSFANMKPDTQTLLWNIIWERGKLFLFICLAAATPLKKILPLLLRCGICFTVGIYLAACVLSMGAWGIVFFLGSCLPHGLFYLAALILIPCVDSHPFYHRKRMGLRKAGWYAGIIFLILTGCILEAVVGVPLLRWIICIIFNIFRRNVLPG